MPWWLWLLLVMETSLLRLEQDVLQQPITSYLYCFGFHQKFELIDVTMSSWCDYCLLLLHLEIDLRRIQWRNHPMWNMWWLLDIIRNFYPCWSVRWKRNHLIISKTPFVWEIFWWWEIVVILTQEKVKVPEMTEMCGRFASHVQIIEGSPVDIISMCLQIRLSFIITLLVFVLNSLMLILCMWFLIQLGGDYSASSFIL